jgi:anti-sigma factor RsiW
MTDRWMDRLSEYLDGDLAPGERTALEAHLADCHACRATLHDLRQVVNRAHALVDRPAGAELWSGIATRIGASGAPVVDLAARRARHRITLSIPQLAAAAVLLVAAGAGATSLALRAPSPPPSAVTAAPDVRAIPAGLPGKAEASFDTAVRELEQALAAGRSRLSPKTVTILERNLARIDVAIEEARAALDADPANAYLNAHLANTMQQKLLLLQQANALASAAS